MIVVTVIFSIVSLAILVVVGSALYGLVWAAVEALLSLVRDLRSRLGSPRTPRLLSSSARPAVVEAGQVPRPVSSDVSTEDLWHRMQGTSSRARRRNQRS